jgi:hypothetical protein
VSAISHSNPSLAESGHNGGCIPILLPGQPSPCLPNLENKTALPRTSPKVGTRFSRNQRLLREGGPNKASRTKGEKKGEEPRNCPSSSMDIMIVSERPSGESRKVAMSARIAEKAIRWGVLPWYAKSTSSTTTMRISYWAFECHSHVRNHRRLTISRMPARSCCEGSECVDTSGDFTIPLEGSNLDTERRATRILPSLEL